MTKAEFHELCVAIGLLACGDRECKDKAMAVLDNLRVEHLKEITRNGEKKECKTKRSRLCSSTSVR
ncbi:MAG: hypothetical protein ABIH23_11525 [bacterium]